MEDFNEIKNRDLQKEMETKLEDQMRKIDVIHNLYNLQKLSYKKLMSYKDELIDDILKSEKIKYINDNLSDIKDLYDRYIKDRDIDSQLINKYNSKLILLNNKVFDKYTEYDKLNSSLTAKINKLEKDNINYKNRITILEKN